MKFVYVLIVAAVVIAVRVSMYRARKRRRAGLEQGTVGTGSVARRSLDGRGGRARRGRSWDAAGRLGDVGIIASREVRERLRGRIFRFGTLAMLIAIGAAIIIPTLHKSSGGPTTQRVGVVGTLSSEAEQLVNIAGSSNQDAVRYVPESSIGAAQSDLRSGSIDLAIVNGGGVLLDQPAGSNGSSADPSLVHAVAVYLGVLEAYHAAGLTPAQAAQVSNAKPVTVSSLRSGSPSSTRTTSVIGLVLLFFMLTQYDTWILIGVMQEKSSRVIEVLMATVRPLQLLGGKVLGIGLVALGQAALIVVFALGVAKAVGSDLLQGTAPLVLGCELLWLILGYAFYCWVYAAAGSMAERQDQVQTLALPLSIPILLGYIFSITVASSGNPDLFFKILAYLPPTAPFCMSVLVGLSRVTWWEFVASVVITLVGTAGMAVFAAGIYRRAVLRTGARVRLREVFGRTAGA